MYCVIGVGMGDLGYFCPWLCKGFRVHFMCLGLMYVIYLRNHVDINDCVLNWRQVVM